MFLKYDFGPRFIAEHLLKFDSKSSCRHFSVVVGHETNSHSWAYRLMDRTAVLETVYIGSIPVKPTQIILIVI